MITTAIVEHGIDHFIGNGGPVVRAVSVDHVRALHKKRFVSDGDDRDAAERKAYSRHVRDAHNERLIAGEITTDKTGKKLELIWTVKES
jgi:hypothetical protein